jgi:large subunit ribosomal protein L29
MDFKELKNKGEAELQKELLENRKKIQELNFKDANKQLKNVRSLRVVKRDSARILTALKANKK